MKNTVSDNSSPVLSLQELTSITPLDGRYRAKLVELAYYFSEYSLIKIRCEIEAKYLIALSEAKVIRKLSAKEKKLLLDFDQTINLELAHKVKEVEKQTRHDVKAMERTIRSLLQNSSLVDVIEKIHFGLTSEDVNNLAYRLMVYRGTQEVILPALKNLVEILTNKAEEYKAVTMLARTHGQAAVPTTLGKELVLFAYRLHKQLKILEQQQLTGKLNGAVGNYNALFLTYPKVNWLEFSQKFINSLELESNYISTQINPYDDLSEYFQIYQRINNVIIDFDQDIWRYISDGWFIQEAKKGEVGSSTMPQKVNPIDFENSEGNLGMANALLEFFSRKLMISRLQRDLSDSTVIRNSGTAMGFCLLGYKSVLTGLSRVRPNMEIIETALQKDWTILTEGVQTILRKTGSTDPYSLIASLSRGTHIERKEWEEWINLLPIKAQEKKLLERITPQSYTGLAVKITEKAVREIRKGCGD